jgi:hypothetical protein
MGGDETNKTVEWAALLHKRVKWEEVVPALRRGLALEKMPAAACSHALAEYLSRFRALLFV